MPDVIVIAGAPGSGKSTVAELLKAKLDSVHVDLGHLRNFHLDPEWKKGTEQEEQMSFENLVLILKNYIKHGYKNIIVDDLKDFRVAEMAKTFPDSIVFSLVPADEVLEKRIKARSGGFTDTARAIQWNKDLRARDKLPNEHVIDNTSLSPEETLGVILEKVQ
jgi:adenylate kinase family enzyme